MKFFIDMHVVFVGDQSLLFCLPLLSDQAPPALGGLWALCRIQVKVVRLNVACILLSIWHLHLCTYDQDQLGWTGLLVEPNSAAFNLLQSKNRKATLVNACLSVHR